LWDYVLSLEIISREFPSENLLWNWVSSLFRGRHEKEARKLLSISMPDDGVPRSLSMKFLSPRQTICSHRRGLRSLSPRQTICSHRRGLRSL
jgi:hypothetical protein